MLAAESAGPAASQPAEDADLDREWRGVVLRGVRPLPGEVPGEAGVHPTFINLGAMGIHGNGHMMMLEKNSDQIADVMEKWVRKSIAE
jgi:hypothetical protein